MKKMLHSRNIKINKIKNLVTRTKKTDFLQTVFTTKYYRVVLWIVD